jgi:hypothetical protein
MYLSQSIERSVVDGYRRFQLYVWRVVLSGTGRPQWKLHRKGYWRDAPPWAADARASSTVRANADKLICFMQDAGPNKFVTMAQSERLTGILKPAALDYLTEHVNDSPTLSNYAKPPKVKEKKEVFVPAPPTPVELAEREAAKARDKMRFWEEKVRHAQAKVKEWQKEVWRRQAKVKRLEDKESE